MFLIREKIDMHSVLKKIISACGFSFLFCSLPELDVETSPLLLFNRVAFISELMQFSLASISWIYFVFFFQFKFQKIAMSIGLKSFRSCSSYQNLISQKIKMANQFKFSKLGIPQPNYHPVCRCNCQGVLRKRNGC